MGAYARVQAAKEARRVFQENIRISLQAEVKEALQSMLMLSVIIVIGAVCYYFSKIDDREDQIARCQNVGGSCHDGKQKISWVRDRRFGLEVGDCTLSSTRKHPHSHFPHQVDAVYFGVVTATTLGYGDETNADLGFQAFLSVYMLFAVVVTAKALGQIAGLPLALRKKKKKEAVLNQFGNQLDVHKLCNICRTMGEGGICSKAEFALAMLQKTGTVDPADIALCHYQFDSLDTNGPCSIRVLRVPGSWQLEMSARSRVLVFCMSC